MESESVIQRHMIRDAARAGHIVVACGGGGIPIKTDREGRYAGIEAVIDKEKCQGCQTALKGVPSKHRDEKGAELQEDESIYPR
jgi:hypothetical protein